MRGPDEPVNQSLKAFYERLLTVLRDPSVRDGRWQLLECTPGWEGNWTNDGFLVFAWHNAEGNRLLVAVNYAANQSQCHVQLPFADLAGKSWQVQDQLRSASYNWNGDDLLGKGLYLDAAPWQASVFTLLKRNNANSLKIFRGNTMKKEQPASGNPVPSETSSALSPYQSRDELLAMGKNLREKCPRADHAVWEPAGNRQNPVDLMEQSNQGRMKHLIPIRHGRMLQSAFAFYRGAALNMAADLAGTPASGIRVQACGDCHLMNFGAFATPERRVIFDINDLDETLPAPWEWDVKRLAASFVLACRENGFDEDDARETVLGCVRSYREHMREFSKMSVLEVWYDSIDMKKVIATIKDEETVERAQKRLAKARESSAAEHDFPKLATTAGLAPTIKDNPPLIFHPRDRERDELMSSTRRYFAQYRETLPESRRLLLDRFHLMDVALKVVGIGSVGTYCAILLLMASEDDSLFLQVKQARPSALEAYAGKSRHANDGQRIVYGCRVMQSASDIFLGWLEAEAGRHFYVRQLRDMKIKPMVEVFTAAVMLEYAELCGWTLAHAHARSGESARISGYLGKNDSFDEAIADFSTAYADQTERDYEVLRKAVRAGKLDVEIVE